MSLYYLILWNQVDILQKHFKKDHVHMRLWTRLYGMAATTCSVVSSPDRVTLKHGKLGTQPKIPFEIRVVNQGMITMKNLFRPKLINTAQARLKNINFIVWILKINKDINKKKKKLTLMSVLYSVRMDQ